jgi:hypothetical protein
VLVVLDHAADAAHVRPLLPGEGSAVLATSRRRLMTLDGAALLEVGALVSRGRHRRTVRDAQR